MFSICCVVHIKTHRFTCSAFFRQKKHLIRSLGLLLTKNNFFKKKQKWQKKITLEKLSKLKGKKENFQNCSKLAFFRLFQISNPNTFLIFGFPSKQIFFWPTNSLLFPKKLIDLYHNTAKIMDQTRGGEKTPFFDPPLPAPQK